MDYQKYFVVNETQVTDLFLKKARLQIKSLFQSRQNIRGFSFRFFSYKICLVFTVTNFNELKKYYIPSFDKALLFISSVNLYIIVMSTYHLNIY